MLTRRSMMSRRLRDERGATLILMALIIIALMAMAGLVVDFGLVRADRQRNKSAADAAVTAGLQNMSSNGWPAPFKATCATLNWLKVNHAETGGLSGTWKRGDGSSLGDDPCASAGASYSTYQTALCSPTNEATWAWYEGTANGGDVQVHILNGYDPDDATKSYNNPVHRDESAHASDPAPNALLGNCANLAVIITEVEQPGLGRVVTSGNLSSRIRTVGQADINFGGDPAVALLLLERHNCFALDIDGNNAQVEVTGTGSRPGIVHADSLGDGCSGGASTILNGLHDSPPGIWARQSPDGTTGGIISVSALSTFTGAQPSRAISSSTEVVAENGSTIGSAPKGRINVDNRYLSHVKTLRGDAKSRFAIADAGQASAAGYTPTNCNPTAADLAATMVWVNCNSFDSSATFTGTEIIFNGKISLTAGKVLSFPNAERVYIYGDTVGGQPTGISISGSTLQVNTSGGACSSVPSSEISKVVLGNGKFDASGNSSTVLRMCHTFFYMMDGNNTDIDIPSSSVDVDDGLPTANGAPPYTNSFHGEIKLGGGGTLEWTAPNVNTTSLPTAAQLANFEDLAYWSETQSESSIAGGGAVTLEGVFFVPNADPFKITGSGGQTITANAQFITRRLQIGGNGTLRITADPINTVPFQILGDFRLIR